MREKRRYLIELIAIEAHLVAVREKGALHSESQQDAGDRDANQQQASVRQEFPAQALGRLGCAMRVEQRVSHDDLCGLGWNWRLRQFQGLRSFQVLWSF